MNNANVSNHANTINNAVLALLLGEASFAFISPEDKDFILAFDRAMASLGYDCGGSIGNGYCWGRYMIIYSKVGVKSRPVLARIYIREDSIALRLYLNRIDQHRLYIGRSPAHIKRVFTGIDGQCRHCGNDHDGICRFRKYYTIDDRLIEKCNGITFEFQQPDLQKLPDYLALLSEFVIPVSRQVP
jgi:hypothetical protein